MGLKIRIREIDGEKRVDPDLMDLLHRFAAHADLCSACFAAKTGKKNAPCKTGHILLVEIGQHPDVSEYAD